VHNGERGRGCGEDKAEVCLDVLDAEVARSDVLFDVHHTHLTYDCSGVGEYCATRSSHHVRAEESCSDGMVDWTGACSDAMTWLGTPKCCWNVSTRLKGSYAGALLWLDGG
jgi:hypothetical protein